LDYTAEFLFVFDNQNAFLHVRRFFIRWVARAPGSLSTAILPRCSSTILARIASHHRQAKHRLGTIGIEAAMEQSSLHSARRLSPPVRSALEQLLGRPLGDNEAISVRAYEPHEAPSKEQQRAIADELRQYFARIDSKSKDIPENEREEILDEAIRSVRPGYRSTR
jgi:hypothetical protein